MARSAGVQPLSSSKHKDYVTLARVQLDAVMQRASNPLYRLRFDAVKRKQEAALAEWDAEMEAFARPLGGSKLRRLLSTQ